MNESSSGKYFPKDKTDDEMKDAIIKEIDAMQCCHCGSTIWEEADYNPKTQIVRVCDQCHTWDENGKPVPILDS